MTQIPRHLILATDLTSRCKAAEERAALLASLWNAQLHIVVVLERDALDGLELIGGRLVVSPSPSGQSTFDLDKDTTLHVLVGDRSARIEEVVRAYEDALIITGPPTRGGVGNIALHGTISRLARRSTSPILVVRDPQLAPYRQIVVAVSEALPSAIAIFAATTFFPSATVTAFHAFSLSYGLFVDDVEAYEQQAKHASISKLRSLLAAWLGDRHRLVQLVAGRGELGAIISDFAQKSGSDLVVVGTHGHAAIAGFFLGSGASEVLEAVTGDLLIVPRRET